jgi:hypothetical protein
MSTIVGVRRLKVKHPFQIILCNDLLNRHVFVEMAGFVYVTIKELLFRILGGSQPHLMVFKCFAQPVFHNDRKSRSDEPRSNRGIKIRKLCTINNSEKSRPIEIDIIPD